MGVCAQGGKEGFVVVVVTTSTRVLAATRSARLTDRLQVALPFDAEFHVETLILACGDPTRWLSRNHRESKAFICGE